MFAGTMTGFVAVALFKASQAAGKSLSPASAATVQSISSFTFPAMERLEPISTALEITLSGSPNLLAVAIAMLSLQTPSSRLYVQSTLPFPSSSALILIILILSLTSSSISFSSSSTPCRWVLKNPVIFFSAIASSTAAAMAVPSLGLVPLPSSSTMTRLPWPQPSSMSFTSSISAPNALFPIAGTSELAPLTKISSKLPTLLPFPTGARRPHCARRVAAPTLLITVLLPDMLGAVRRAICPSSLTSFLTASPLLIQYGYSPFRSTLAPSSSISTPFQPFPRHSST
mmetsp:Transcript_9410/g.18818  ORF Transcript_9410/g.18818 Transcript_9410/m.18818 type:complete len:286 (-) Transcript_9410:566-1423(-)